MRRAAILTIAFVCAIAAGCVGVVVAAVRSLNEREAPSAPLVPSTEEIARPTAPAFAIPEPRPLDRTATARWATLVRTTSVYAAPSPDARPIGRVGGTTPEGTANIVLLRRHATDASGRSWAFARIPGFRNKQEGWLPQDALGPGGVSRARVTIDRRALTLTFRHAGRVVLTAPVGLGTPDAPTPLGSFYVRNKLTRFASPRYGPLAFGLSARSTLTDWPGGGFIGIHGTDRPDLLPGRVSHGCIRLGNEDIVRLGRALRVGTPVEIV